MCVCSVAYERCQKKTALLASGYYGNKSQVNDRRENRQVMMGGVTLVYTLKETLLSF